VLYPATIDSELSMTAKHRLRSIVLFAPMINDRIMCTRGAQCFAAHTRQTRYVTSRYVTVIISNHNQFSVPDVYSIKVLALVAD
jgi:hypothetical protein